MKKNILFILLLFISISSYAQDRFFELEDQIGHHIKLGNKIVFYTSNPSLGQDDKVYVTDGTTEGTKTIGSMEQIRFPNSYLDYPSNGVLNGELYFSAKENQNGNFEVWKTDGTEEGTIKVSSVDPTVNANPRLFVPLNGKMYFIANSSFGEQFLNTSAIFSIDAQGELESYPLITNPGTQFENYRGINNIEVWNGKIYAFSVDTDNIYTIDPSTGNYSQIGSLNGIIYWQPTSVGIIIAGAPTGSLEINDSRLFLINESDQLIELKNSVNDESDFVSTFNYDTYMISEGGRIFHEAQGRIYYIANSATATAALWSTDGTSEGTVIHYEANFSVLIRNLFSSGGNLFFTEELDLNNDGFEEGDFLMKFDPVSEQIERVTKDEKLVWLFQRNRTETIYYDIGFVRADDYIFFPASLVKPEYFQTGDSLFSDLILAVDGNSGGLETVISEEADINNTGIINILGETLLVTGYNSESTPKFTDDFFTFDISGFEITDPGSGSSSGSGSLGKLFYENRFAKIDTILIPDGWEITKTSNPNEKFLGWSVTSSEWLPVNPQWFDLQLLSVFVLNTDETIGFNTPDEEIISHPISIAGKQGLNGSIEFTYNPYFMNEINASIHMDARIDDGSWQPVLSLRKGGNVDDSPKTDTLSFDLSEFELGNELQFRFRVISSGVTSTFGGVFFGFDRLKLYEKIDESNDSFFTEETTIFIDDFTVSELNEQLDNTWTLTQSAFSELQGFNSTWRYDGIEAGIEFEGILPGLSFDGFLLLTPFEETDWTTSMPIQYDEIIVSPIINIGSDDSLRLSLNAFFQDFVFVNDEVEFKILGRPDSNAVWQELHEIQNDPNKQFLYHTLDKNEIDFNLSDKYSESTIQLGLQLRINKLDFSRLSEGFWVDSVRIYSRNRIKNQSPIVINAMGSLLLSQDFGEQGIANLNSVFEDPEEGKLDFIISSNSDLLDPKIRNDSLIVTSISGKTGKGEIIVQATDPIGLTSEDIFSFEIVTGTSNEGSDLLPKKFVLEKNYPNPFNPTSSIRFGLPEAEYVKMEVFNIVGHKVATLLNRPMQAGWHTVQFNASGLSSGVYIYRIQAGDFVQTKKMMLIK